MDKMTIEQIATFVKGSCKAGEVSVVESVSIDSRKVGRNCMFVALPGERVDGHDFIADAVSKGAVAVLSEQAVPGCTVPVIQVEDTGKALLDLAAGVRRLLPALKTVGVTGSVGKTTTKEMIACVLGEAYKTVKTHGNLNNQIGLPLTVFRVDSSAQVAVFEMGMSARGEISALTRIVRPDVGVITNIGISHIEFLGSREAILQAKLEIVEGMRKESTLVLNGDEPLLYSLKDSLPCKALYYGIENEDCDVRALDVTQSATQSNFTIESGDRRYSVTLEVGGTHNIMNALAAAAVAEVFVLTEEQVQDGLARFENTGMRQNIYEACECTIIEDCYNASPDSMRAALRVLRDCPVGGKKIAVLGDMGELGEYAESAHLSCGATAALCADSLFVLGEQAAYYKKGALDAGMREEEVYYGESHEGLAARLRECVSAGDAILFKGSRFMKMENVLRLFKGEEVDE